MRAVASIIIVACSFLLVLHYQFNLLKQLTTVSDPLLYAIWSGIPIGLGMFIFWSMRPKDLIQAEKEKEVQEDALVQTGQPDPNIKTGSSGTSPAFDAEQSFVSFDKE